MPSITVSQRTRPTQPFVLTDEQGAEIDLTGKTLHFVAKRALTDPDAVVLFNIAATADGDQVANKGKYTLAFTYGQTTMPPGNYPAALHVWDSGSAPPTPPQRVEAGSYTVLPALLAVES